MTVNQDIPQCGICLEPIKTEMGKMDSCTHTFCFTCIFEWSKVTNLCPFCKKEFTKLTKQSLVSPSPNSKRISPKRKSDNKVVKIKPKKQRVYDDDNFDWDQYDEEDDYDDEDFVDMDNYDLNDTFIDDRDYVEDYVDDEDEEEFNFPLQFHRVASTRQSKPFNIEDSDDDVEEVQEENIIDLTERKHSERKEIMKAKIADIRAKRHASQSRSNEMNNFILDDEEEDLDYVDEEELTPKKKNKKTKPASKANKLDDEGNNDNFESPQPRRRLIKPSQSTSSLIDLCTPDAKQTKITSYTIPVNTTTTTTTSNTDIDDIEEFDTSAPLNQSTDPILCSDSENEVAVVVVAKKNSPKKKPKLLCAQSPDKPPKPVQTIVDDGAVILGTPKRKKQRKKVQEDEYDSDDSTYISDTEMEALAERWNSIK